MTNFKASISAQDTTTLLDCYTIMVLSDKTEAHERMTFALICDELESRGVLVWNEETEEYEATDITAA